MPRDRADPPREALQDEDRRRDAQKLADLLWLNRGRLAAGRVVRGLRRVHMVSDQVREDRQLTSLRKTLGQRLIRTVNKVRRIVNRHNLIWEYPTKTFQTQADRRWLASVSLPGIDRLEMDVLPKNVGGFVRGFLSVRPPSERSPGMNDKRQLTQEQIDWLLSHPELEALLNRLIGEYQPACFR